MVERRTHCPAHSAIADLRRGQQQMATARRVICHLAGVRKGREADLSDVRSGKSVLAKRSNRIAVTEPAFERAHVEMRIERDQPDPFERQAKRLSHAQHSRPGHRIIAPNEQRQPVGQHTLRNGLRQNRGRSFDAEVFKGKVPTIEDRTLQLAALLDVESANPPKHRPKRRRSKVAASRSHRSHLHWSADPSDRRALVTSHQFGKVGPAARHCLSA